MMNKSLRGRGHESSATAKTPTTNLKYGFQRPGRGGRWRRRSRRADGAPDKKKSRRFRRLLKVDNREASNRVDRSHSVSDQGRSGYKAEALIDRK
jgi:hypothetical protein